LRSVTPALVSKARVCDGHLDHTSIGISLELNSTVLRSTATNPFTSTPDFSPRVFIAQFDLVLIPEIDVGALVSPARGEVMNGIIREPALDRFGFVIKPKEPNLGGL
jgi:hypothetical protein